MRGTLARVQFARDKCDWIGDPKNSDYPKSTHCSIMNCIFGGILPKEKAVEARFTRDSFGHLFYCCNYWATAKRRRRMC